MALDVTITSVAGSTAKPAPPHHPERTITVDVSIGGMCLDTKTLYPVGSTLSCTITVPDHPTPVELMATVAWFQKISQDAPGYRLGVEFSEITVANRALLERLVLEPPTTQVTRTQKLLLVDDDYELVQALKVRCESVGFQVLTATDGLQALELSRSERPQLILLDLMLPKLNGYEVCRLLKFDPKFHTMPIILLTARARPEDMELGHAVGADAYITKPFDGTALLDTIEAVLAKTRP